VEGDPGSSAVIGRLWELADECTPALRVDAYTQAIMDLGATLCTRARPACTLCPMSGDCVAAREGRQQELPARKRTRARPTRQSVLLIAQSGNAGCVYLERRPDSGLWGGLWSPPQFDDDAAALAWCGRIWGDQAGEVAHLEPIDHAFTHFDLRLMPLRIQCAGPPAVKDGGEIWYSLDDPPRLGLPQPIKRLFERLRAERVAQVE
jgi:A/G-specific adenine glycosylase